MCCTLSATGLRYNVDSSAHFAHLHVPLCELLKHILRSERIVQLDLEVLDLRFGIRELGFGEFQLAYICQVLLQAMDGLGN